MNDKPNLQDFISQVDDAFDDVLDNPRKAVYHIVIQLWELYRDADLKLSQATARLAIDDELAERYRLLEQRTRELELHRAVFGPGLDDYGKRAPK